MSISDVLEALKREISPSDAVPAPPPAGWSDRLQRETLEPVPDHPGQWREPKASAALCTRCSDPLAEGDLLSCVAHRAQLGVTERPHLEPVAVTYAPVIGLHDLLALAEMRGWEALPFKPGESAGGTEQMWRTFAGWVHGERLRLVLAAVWERWGSTVEQYSQDAATAAPEGTVAA
jgi:hypothetical protein